MQSLFGLSLGLFRSTMEVMQKFSQVSAKTAEAALDEATTVQTYLTGITKYTNAFMAPSFNAMKAFTSAERRKLRSTSLQDSIRDYNELWALNLRLGSKAYTSGLSAMTQFYYKKMNQSYSAWISTLCGDDGNDIVSFTAREKEVAKVTVHEYPKAIQDIKSEYGFQFAGGDYEKVTETERFELYRVLPTDKSVPIGRKHGKPILIIPPYVLGGNILAFLPRERKSYVHSFADQGIPTYIRLIKDIDTTPAVQIMTGEDDARDLRFFGEKLMARHGNQVTLNGFCQGGYNALTAILSGELDGIVDALITNATPIDGTRSKSLTDYILSLPPRFRDISYATKTLPNGNRVIDGKIMGWVYKLRKMESESPMVAFLRDLNLFDSQRGHGLKISKTAAAINYWITYDQKDLPLAITKMSFDSYRTPISRDGTLPVKLFGRELNLRRIKEMGIPWLICIADKDDLVDKESSLAPLDFVNAEVTVFPKGHAAIATSWSLPSAEWALHLCFCPPDVGRICLDDRLQRGPVRFHLDLEDAMEVAASARAAGDKRSSGNGSDNGPDQMQVMDESA